jgi:MFS family permease
MLFIIFAIGGALSTSINMLTTFRFLGGCSVACVTLNPSIAGDMFVQE